MQNLISYFKKTLEILEKKFLYRILFLTFLTFVSGFLEILSIGLLLPILSVFIEGNFYKYQNYFPIISNYSEMNLIIILLLIFLFIYFLKFISLTFIIYSQNKFAQSLYVDISSKILNNYLSKSYLFHIQNPSSTLIRNLTSEINLFSTGVVFPIIKIFSEIIIFILICTTLIFYEPVTSFIVILMTVLFGALILIFSNYKIKNWGDIRQKYSSLILNTLQQSFFGFKEIILYKLKYIYLSEFNKYNLISAEAKQKKDTLTQLPRLILELISVTTFFLVIYILILIGKELSEIFIIISVFVFSSLRLLPSITNIVKSIQNLKYNHNVINLINAELSDYWKNQKKINEKFKFDEFFFEEISLKNISYSYPNKKDLFSLKNINLTIKKNDKIGIMGETGSGKTTLINIITGLLTPTSGEMIINNKQDLLINEWQNSISYVPQKIYISNSSIKFNITFKEILSPKEEIKLTKVLKIVQMYDYVNSLEKKWDTLIGEEGNNFSGGQNQRLGIARALYKNSKILILDEATSALDKKTENKILSKIFSSENKKTIISISHNKNSIEYCQKIYLIKNGTIEKK